MPGHLFVAPGDPTRLACDAVVAPDGVRGGRPSPTTLAHRAWDAIEAAGDGLVVGDGRARPLVALPLVDRDRSGTRGRRAEVVSAFLEAGRRRAPEVDVALVLPDLRDLAAVQERRTDDDWCSLPPALVEEADRLGWLAGAGELAVFVGAGVSLPVGVPDRWTLLRAIAAEDPAVDLSTTRDLRDAASTLVRSRGESAFLRAVRARVSPESHGIGHALLAGLAGLGVRHVVTTNLDRCLEHAATDGRVGPLRLDPDLARAGPDRDAGIGVVRALLLTGHLLYVGPTATDADYLAVSGGSRHAPRGTALALTTRDVGCLGHHDLVTVPMSNGESYAEAARVLEIFLDRLAWAAARAGDRASAYLLDEAYSSGLPPEEQALKDALLELTRRSDVERSTAWPQVAALLERLGLRA